jgi:hypothetical protein
MNATHHDTNRFLVPSSSRHRRTEANSVRTQLKSERRIRILAQLRLRCRRWWSGIGQTIRAAQTRPQTEVSSSHVALVEASTRSVRPASPVVAEATIQRSKPRAVAIHRQALKELRSEAGLDPNGLSSPTQIVMCPTRTSRFLGESGVMERR